MPVKNTHSWEGRRKKVTLKDKFWRQGEDCGGEREEENSRGVCQRSYWSKHCLLKLVLKARREGPVVESQRKRNEDLSSTAAEGTISSKTFSTPKHGNWRPFSTPLPSTVTDIAAHMQCSLPRHGPLLHTSTVHCHVTDHCCTREMFTVTLQAIAAHVKCPLSCHGTDHCCTHAEVFTVTSLTITVHVSVHCHVTDHCCTYAVFTVTSRAIATHVKCSLSCHEPLLYTWSVHCHVIGHCWTYAVFIVTSWLGSGHQLTMRPTSHFHVEDHCAHGQSHKEFSTK